MTTNKIHSFAGKSRKSSKASAKAGDEQKAQAIIDRDKIYKHPYTKTTYHIDYKGGQRERQAIETSSYFSGKKTKHTSSGSSYCNQQYLLYHKTKGNE